MIQNGALGHSGSGDDDGVGQRQRLPRVGLPGALVPPHALGILPRATRPEEPDGKRRRFHALGCLAQARVCCAARATAGAENILCHWSCRPCTGRLHPAWAIVESHADSDHARLRVFPYSFAGDGTVGSE